MDLKNLTDYYPVYKDIYDLMHGIPSDHYPENPGYGTDLSSHHNVPGSEFAGSAALFTGEALIELSLNHGLSAFQTVLLLIKSSFEGHVLLNFNVRPDQLFSQGTTLFQAKPEIMILNFYENFFQYMPGLNQIWMTLQERDQDLAGINFELLVHTFIVHHLIRFPVSLFSSTDIRSYTDLMLMNQQAMNQRLDLVLLGERSVGEFEFIEEVNNIYARKYKEYMNQLRLKEDVFSHYQRKLILALLPDINTEKELDDLMYSKLLEEKMSRTSKKILTSSHEGHAISETLIGKLRIREKTKVLYRTISKNCSEVHSTTDSENRFPELTQIFLMANSIYIQPVTNLSEALLQYMKLVRLLSKVLIFRKINGFPIETDQQQIVNLSWKEVVSKDDLRSIRKNLDARLVEYRLKSLTDYKLKFIFDDDLTDIHNHFLQKQIEFMDQQIVQIQSDISEVLKMKAEVSILKTNKN